MLCRSKICIAAANLHSKISTAILFLNGVSIGWLAFTAHSSSSASSGSSFFYLGGFDAGGGKTWYGRGCHFVIIKRGVVPDGLALLDCFRVFLSRVEHSKTHTHFRLWNVFI